MHKDHNLVEKNDLVEKAESPEGKESHALHVSLQSFEGPLDLLLFLVQKKKLNIYDIPITEITESYLEYLKRETAIDLEDLTSFYSMATLLLYIKSRILLPVSEEDADMQDDIEDPRTELVEKLIQYQKFRKLSQLLDERMGENSSLLVRNDFQSFPIQSEHEIDWKKTNKTLLFKTFVQIRRRMRVPQHVIHLDEKVSINEKITLLYELLEKEAQCTFRDLFRGGGVMSLVCSLLAVLELLRRQVITAVQKEHYGIIHLFKRGQK